MTVADLYKKLLSTLTPVLGDSEARSAARVILEDVRGITQTDLVVNGHRTVEPETLKQIEEISDRICAGEPVQYAVGSARFYGMDFKVNPSVLIPRPETEGLVDMIVRDYGQRSDLRVLDCGTGSGCIAIALARNLPFASVDAIDISPDALKVATDNSSRLKVKVNFSCRDILHPVRPDEPTYDIIVSNPPYIADRERKDMDTRVTDYEPSTALFVPDSDPLIFYRAITQYATLALKKSGGLYFEINPLYADLLRAMLEDNGFDSIEILRDYIGRYRYAKAILATK